MEDIVTRLRRAVDNEPFMLGGEHDLLKDALMEITTLLGCCDGAASQDAHIRREREEHRAEVEKQRAEIERLRENVDRAGKEVERADRLRAEIARVKADERKNRAEIVKLRAEIERLREALRWYADQRNHFPVEHRRPGDPDPAVIFVEEPPIMLDGGERARRALEGKP